MRQPREEAMRGVLQILLSAVAVGCLAGQAEAQWWVEGASYSLRADKYDSFYSEARPVRWSVERPPGVLWRQMHPPKRSGHAARFADSSGYPAVYRAAYPAPYHAGIPTGDAAGYQYGYPIGFPVDLVSEEAQRRTWRPPVVQIDPLPGDEDETQRAPRDASPMRENGALTEPPQAGIMGNSRTRSLSEGEPE